MNDLLLLVLRDPGAIRHLSPSGWELLIRQGRAAMLLGRLDALIDEHELTEFVPDAARRHLTSARAIVQGQQRSVRWEVECIKHALEDTDAPIILLKGAAYVMANLPAAAGRFMSDVDILVQISALQRAEAALLSHGWMPTHGDRYDQRYYREWMHELPPLRHMRRGTVVDVHHAILPRTARIQPNSEKLLSAAIPLAADHRFSTLAPVDMLLHSAAHLFHDGEFEHGLRDLADMDNLLRDFGDADFWQQLAPRAIELQLTRPLFYALRYARLLLGTPVPEEVTLAVDVAVGGRPSRLLLEVMDALFLRSLRPPHVTAMDRFTALARWLIYVRGHWLRMPPSLLIRHLMRKLLSRSQRGKQQVSA